MTRPTSNNPKKRRMRSRLRERLDDLLAQKPLPVRQERLAAPQVRLLESRFVLDASAALVGLDALSSGWEAESAEVQSDASSHRTADSSQEHISESVQVSATGPVHSYGEARQFASTVASNDVLGLDLDLGVGSDLTSQLDASLVIASPKADSAAGDSNSVELALGEVELSSEARFTAGKGATHSGSGGDLTIERSGQIDRGQVNPVVNEIVFIDAGVQDHETLAADFREGVEVLILESTQDGVTQISQALEGRADLDAIHLVSHGSAGSVQLGSTELSSDSMARYADALSQIGSSLTESGDLMLYGCDVAQGEIGQAFISALATATDADVAASNDRTGNAGLSGDWVLESSSGDVGTAALIDDVVTTDYAYVLNQPEVLSVEVSDTTITDSDDGSSFDVTVTFDQAMDTGGAFQPTLTFDPDVLLTGTLINPSAGTWSVSDTVFTKTFEVADVGVEVANVEIDVTGAQNSIAEAQTDYTSEAEFSIDTLNPTVVVNIVDSQLNDGNSSSLVTFEFSEDVTGFDANDLTPVNGVISGFTANDGDSYEATFTADDGLDGIGSVTVGADYTDAEGNEGSGASDSVTIDTENPTATVDLDATSLSDSNSSTALTITFTEVPTGFDAGTDLTVTGGVLGTGSFDASNKIWTATFTANDGITGTGSVLLAPASYTDAVGNEGSGDSDSVTIDTENPTATVDLDATSLSDSNSSTALTITFTEVPTGFDAGTDLTVTGGVLGTGSFDASNKIWTATFTANDGITGTGSVLLAPASYTDAAGNEGNGDSDSLDIDTENPTVDVNIVDSELTDVDDTSLVTFEFSEAVVGFDASDLSLVGGSISNFMLLDANSFTALFTATDGVELVGQVSVVGNYTDVAGNTGVVGLDTVDIDTLNPTVVVDFVESLLTDSTASSSVTFTFSEDVSGFDVNDVTSSLGAISGFTMLDASNYEATFTATDGIDANGAVVVAANYTDLAGNLGNSGSDAVSIDTLNPTVTVNVVEAVMTDDNSTSLVTFEFSEDVSGFDVNDVASSFGSISGFIVVNASRYRATFTASDGVDAVGQVAVVADYTDLVGNAGTTGLDTVAIDRLNPTVNVDIFDNELTDAEPSSLVTFEFSEDVTGFDASDLSTVGGSISDFAIIDANTYTALFTASDGVAMTGSVTVSGGYEDFNGNVGVSGFDNVTIDRVNPTVASIERADADYTNATSVDFTVTFTENVTGVDLDGADFSLVTSVAGASIVSVAGSGSVYIVTVGTGSTGGSIGLALAATPTIQDAVGNDLTDTAVSGANENYTIASTEVLLIGGNVSVVDIRDATADDLTLSVSGGDLIISSSSDVIAAGTGVNRVNASSVRIALADISGSNGVTVSTGGLDDTVTVEGVGRRLDINGGSGTDAVQFQTNAITTDGGDLIVFAESITQDADASLAAGDVNMTASAGDMELNAALSATGDLVVNVSGQVSQTLSGVLIAAGDTTVSASSIVLDNASNDFQGVVNASGADLTFVDSNGISLGDIDATGAFSVTALSGSIDDDAADANGADLNVAGVATFAASGMIALDDQWNDFGDQINVDAQDLVLAAQGDVLLFDVDVDQLTITAVGDVSDGESGSVLVAGNASFAGSAVTLGDNAGNVARFGSLTFNASGVVDISEASSMFVSGSSTAGAGLELVSTGGVTLNASVTVVGDTSILAGAISGGITVNAKLNGSGTILLDSAGEITIDAAIDPTTVTLNADDDITVNSAVVASELITVSAGEDGSGSFVLGVAGSLETTDSGSDITVTTGSTSGDITLAGTTTALDLVTMTTASGSINGSGLVTSGTVDLNSSTGIGNTTGVTLSSSNITADTTTGDIEIASSLGTAVSVSSLTTGAGAISLAQSGGGDLSTGTVSASGAVVLSNSAGSISLAGIVTSVSLDATASGAITDGSDGDLTITGLAEFTAGNIELGNAAGNATNFGTLTFNSAGSVTVSEDSSLDLVGTNAAGSADVDSVAGVSDSGAVSVDVTGLLDVSGTSIALGSGTSVFNTGSLTFSSAGSVTINEDSSLDLVGTNAAGSADLDSVAGVSDSGAVSVDVTGLLDVSGTSIALGSGASVFNAGTLTFSSAGSVTINEASSLDLVGVNTAGSADLDSTAGVSDSGAVSVDVAGLLDVSGTAIALGSGTSVFNTGSLTFSSAGSVTINEDSSLDLVGVNTANSADVDSVAGVSDSGAVSVDVAGLLDVSGTSIALGSGTSVFNTGSLTFSSAGSVTINEDSSLDLVGVNTANSADVDSVAGVSDSGAVSVDVAGLLDVSGTSIALGSGTSVFNTGSLTFSSAGSVTINEDSSLDLVGVNTAGSADLDSVAGVSDAGAASVDVSGLLDVSGTSIALGSGVTVFNTGTLTFNSAGSVTVSEASSLDLVAANTAGNANLNSAAGVSDAAAASVDVTGLLDVSGSSIALGSGASVFNAGTMTFSSAGSVTISEDSSLDLVGVNTAGSADLDSVAGVSDAGAVSVDVSGLLDITGTSIVLGSGTLNAGTLTFNSAGSVSVSEDSSLDLVGTNAAGNADLDSVAGVSDSGAVSVDVTGLLDVSGTSIALGSGASVLNVGTLIFSSAGSVTINEASSLDLVGVNTAGSADLDSTAGVSDSGAVSVDVAGLLDVSGTAIALGSGTSVFNTGSLTFSSAGSVTINEDSSLDLVGVNTANSADVDSVAGVSDSGAVSVDVAGLLDVSGTSIALGSGTSVFNTGSLTFSSAGSVTINEDSSLDLVGVNTANSADVDSTAGVSDSSAVSVDVAGLLDVSGTSIALGSGTSVFNVGSLTFSSSGSVTINEDSSLDLVGVNTAGSADLDSVAGVSDAGAASVDVSGLLDVSGTSIALGSGVTVFNTGTLTFNSAGSVNVSEASSMFVSGSSTAGAGLELVSTGGVTLNASVTVVGDTSILAGAISGGITVNAKLNGSGTILLDSAGEITIDAAIDPTTVTLNADDDITVNSAVVASELITVSAGEDGSGSFVLGVAGSLETTDSGSDITVTTGSTSGDITLAGTTTALDLVTMTTASGSINGSGLVTSGTVDLNSSTGIGNTTGVTLSSSNITADTTTGDIEIASSLGTAVSVSSLTTGAGAISFAQSGGGDLSTGTVSASGAVVLSNSAGSISLAGIVTSVSLDATASGAITDGSDGDLTITGLAEFTAGNIELGNAAGNATNFGTLTFNSAGSVNVSEASSMFVSGSSTAGAGLELVSTGGVTLNASVTVVGDTSILAGAISGGITVNAKLNGSGTILLDSAGEITIDAAIDPTTVTLNADDDITVNSAVVASELITVSAGEDGSGSFVLGVAGSLETTDSGSDITVTTGSTSGDITLAGTTTALDLVTMTTASGSINGSGLVTSGTVDLNSSTGIGNTTGVTLSSSNITADTTTGDIEIASSLGTAVSVSSLTTGAGAISFAQSGGGDLSTGTVSASGAVVLSNSAGSISLAGIVTSVSLDATASGAITDGSDGDLTITGLAEFTAGNIELGNAAGNATNFGTLTFNSAGSVNVSEASSMFVSGSSTAGAGLELVSTGGVTLNASVTVVGDTSILAGAISGGITVNAKLNGSGTILLDSAGEITIDAAIDPTTVTLNADDDITVNSAVVASELITVSAGEDGSGSFVLGVAGSLETTDSGSDITVTTGSTSGDITLAGTTTALDLVTMTTASGSINGSGLVTSGTVDLNSSTGVGNTTGVTLSSSNITADTTTGDIEIASSLGTAVSVSSLTTGTGTISFAQSGGGDITFVGPVSSGGAVNGGNITLTASDGLVVGGALSSALGTGGNLLVSGATLSGAVTVGAGDVVIQGGFVDLVVDSAIVAGGDVTLSALRDVIINAVVDADNGGSIIVAADTNSASDPGAGVGGHGGVRVTTAGQLDAEGGVVATGSDLFATTGQVDSVLIDADGGLAQILAIGNITLADGSNAPANAMTMINGVVQASGAAATITINSEKDVVVGVLGSIVSVDGTITITADTGAGLNGGVVLMADGGSVSSGTGQIAIAADGDITLGSLSTGSTGDNAVALTTTSGAIVDGGDTGTDVNANSGGLIIRSDAGVGVVNAIETSVAKVDVENVSTGAIHLFESDDVFIESLSQLGSGEILFDSDAGTVEVLASGSGVTGSENVRLAALGQGVTINADVVSGTGNITLDAANDLTVNAAVSTGGSGTLYMVAGNNIAVNDSVTTVSGDILVDAGLNLTQDAAITSTSGDVGLVSGGTLNQTASGDVSTGGDVLVSAGSAWTMADGTEVSATGNVSGEASSGDLTLGVINAANVGLRASGSIIDANAGSLNITAVHLSLRADGGLIGDHDNTNVTPGQNVNAIEIAVSTLAASSDAGIYVSEADGLTVTTVAAVTVDIESVVGVNFNSTTTDVSEDQTSSSLEDLSTTTDGPIKLVSLSGSLTIEGGSDGVGVSADGVGDVLIEARGAGSDVTIDADVVSGTGNITLGAANDLTVNAAVSTGGSGTLYMVAGNDIAVNDSVTTVSGDILFDAGLNLTQDAAITSTSGDVGLVSGGTLNQTASGDVSTGGDVLVSAGSAWTMADGTEVSATGNVSGEASSGDLTLGVINAANVGLRASGSIIDANAGSLNITAVHLSLRADGGLIGDHDNTNVTPGQNVNAIEIAVSTLAASSDAGIYVSEADGLTVTTVAAVTVDIESVVGVNFNSTTTDVSEDQTSSSLEDLSTTTDGPIKLVSLSGSLTIEGGSDGVGVSADGVGDVLIEARGAGSDVTIDADVVSGIGNITLGAANDLTVNSSVSTSGSGTLYMVAGNDIAVNDSVTTVSGDILFDAGLNLTQDAAITSTSGDVGLISGGTLNQTASGDVSTGGDVLVSAGSAWTMADGTEVSATGNVSGQASSGDLTLGVINAANVGLRASGSIIDANAGSLNITAVHLSLRADGGLIGDHDNTNVTPGQNVNAIEIAVSTLAASSDAGIYVSEADGLTVTTVAAVTVDIESVVGVNFNSTTTDVSEDQTSSSLEDLSTTTDGPIKLVSLSGSLTIEGGSDGVGVSAGGVGDVLIEARGAGSDVTINADVVSGTGNITLDAANDLTVNAAVSTGGSGTLYMVAGNDVAVNDSVTTVSGDILVDAGLNLTQDAAITSTSGDVGLISGGTLNQTASGDVSTGGDVLVSAGSAWTMADGTEISATGNVSGQASSGDLTLGVINAANVGLRASGSIIDANAGSLNITAVHLSLRADGGLIGDHDNTNVTPGQNVNAIELAVSTLAASSDAGIYVSEADGLTVTTVAAVTVDIESVVGVNFNSTTTDVSENQTSSSLEDLSTTTDGPIKLVSLSGSLTIEGGSDGVGVSAGGVGDVLIEARGAGSDVTINADVVSGTGNITLDAANDLTVNSSVSTSGSGTLYMVAGNDIAVNDAVTTVSGDILFDAGLNLTQDAAITSTSGDVGLVSGGTLNQTASGDVSTGGDVLVSAGSAWTMADGTEVSATGNVSGEASSGDLTLGVINAANVGLRASGSIIDANAGSLNITAVHLSLRADAGLIGDHDNANVTPGQNVNAIELAVSTLAASSDAGIYVSEADGLTVTTVAAVTVDIESVVGVNFNSTTTDVSENQTSSSLEDLSTTTDGPIKLVSLSGSLTIEGGSDGVGVSAGGVGDVLIEARGAGSDVTIDADVVSGTGNITLDAANDLTVNAAVSTGGSGTLYMVAGNNIAVNDSVTTVSGDILVDAGLNLTQDAAITSTSGDVGLVSGGTLNQTASGDVSTGGDVLVSAGSAWTMADGTEISATGNVSGQASSGDLTLGVINAANVGLRASGSIIDANAGSLNITAVHLSLRADGGLIGDHDNTNVTPGQNVNAIELAVSTLAASSDAGIYVSEADGLTVMTVAAVTVDIESVVGVNFNSTTTDVSENQTSSSLEDLSTTTDGPIKLVSLSGSLTIEGGSDGVGVSAGGVGDVLIEARGAGSDVTINADVVSGAGNITLGAANDLTVNAAVSTGGSGTLYMVAGNNIAVNDSVTTVSGDILVDAGLNLTQDAAITSTSGDVGLVSGGTLNQTASGDVSTGGDVLVSAGSAWTMADGTEISATGNVSGQASSGDLTLGVINAANVGLRASGSIIDANAGSLNITAVHLSLRADGGLIGDHDNTNVTPGQNVNAIELAVSTLAASSDAGIYVSEADGLTVTTVAAVTVDIESVVGVNFNSTTTDVSENQTSSSLEDLSTTTDGPIKLVSLSGSLTIEGGSDGVGVSADGVGDVLIEARGAGSDVTINADVVSGTGNITLGAANDLTVNAAVSTGGSGTLYMVAGNNIAVNDSVTTVSGDILVDAGLNLTQDAAITSTNGDVGLISGGTLNQTASGDVSTGGDVLVSAGSAWTMADGTEISATGNVSGQASSGDLTLGVINAANVGLRASGSIIDANAGSLNVSATNLSLVATNGLIGGDDSGNGSPGTNLNAIELAVSTLAASSDAGIYVSEADGLTVTTVAAVTVDIESVVGVNFNSTTTDVSEDQTSSSLEDLSTTTDGPIKLVSLSGSLTIEGGSDGVGVSADGVGDVLIEARGAGSDVTINADVVSGTGNITLDAANDLTVNAAVSTGGSGTLYMVAGNNIAVNDSVTTVSGDILFDAGLNLTQDAAITSSGGNVGLIAGGFLSQTSDGDISTDGDVLLEAGSAWTMAGDTVITATGNVVGQALGGDVGLGVVSGANVALTASNSILDANLGALNVSATDLSLAAMGGVIGGSDTGNGNGDANVNAIDIAVSNLAANAEFEIYLSETDSLTVTTVAALTVNLGSALRANFNSTASSVARTRTASSLEDLNSKTDSPIKLVSLNGSLTIEGGADSEGVSAGGNGDVLLEARGASGNIIINADVISGTGHITLDAANDLSVNAAVTTAGAGVVYLISGNDVSVSGSLNNENGDLLLHVAGDLEQTGVLQSVLGDVGLIVGGDLTQGGSSAVTTGGNLLVESVDDWTMLNGSVISVGGSQLIGVSGGTITLGRITMSNLAANHVGLNAVGDILDGNGADANVEESNALAETVVALRAGGEIGSTLGADAGSNVQALDLAVDRLAAESSFGIHLKQLASGINLVIGQVAGQTVDVVGVLRNQFNGTVVAVANESGSVFALEDLVTTDNGEIELVVDGGDLKFLDGADADGPDLKADPEVVASGAMGRIDLRASGVLELEDNVQFHADKVTAEYADPMTRPMPGGAGPSLKSRAIHLQSDSVVLGTDVELFTGVDQGTARIFAPRPIEYTVDDNGVTIPVTGAFPTDSAFYDASTVFTSELVQVNSRNLVGTLFIDVGNVGERGLTLDVDWGAASQRYQQVNGLSSDLNVLVGVNGSGQPTTPVPSPGSGTVTLEHFYTDMDLLFSRANGRSTVTDPLIVRFAVRHHESIFVQAGAVQQDLGLAESVTGGIVSSTDNPGTPRGGEFGLESGHHRFIIPNVPEFSVPIIPQREVIPSIEVVSFLPAVELDSVALDVEVGSATSSAVVSATRDEYFQLRVLRPDQNAEPFGVFRLADDIMTGDKLQQLQRSLPDGRYEIEYVLGDTFSRVVLRFDVRNGEPVIPEDALDEGELLLEEVPEQSEAESNEENPGVKVGQPPNGGQDSRLEDQSILEHQSHHGLVHALKMSLDHLGISSWEPLSETGVMVPVSAVPLLSSTENEFSSDATVIEPLLEPVASDVEKSPEQVKENSEAEDTSLQAVSAGLVLTTALQRRRQRSERKKLSRSARFAARRESVENLHDSESI